jgi:AraC family transcriptional regulator
MITIADDILLVSKRRPDGSKLIYSRLHAYDHLEKASNSFSIKFVLDGVEHYKVNQHTHSVRAGQFLLVNQQQSFEVDFAAKEAVLGICLYLNEELIHDIYRNLNGNEEYLLDNPFRSESQPFDFHETVYNTHQNSLGNYLQYIASLTDKTTGQIGIQEDELFYQATDYLLQTQRHVIAQVKRIPAQRRSTQQELFRRISKAKDFLDEHFQSDVTNSQLADLSAMSEYHFFRTFKQVFGRSPHQYLIDRRLQQALSLIHI